MAAQSSEEIQRRLRRKRILQGLLVGAAAVGIPALANTVIRRRAGKLQPAGWGRTQRYFSEQGEVVFQRLGRGPALVLLHSFGPGHNADEWQQAGEILAERFRVYAPDLLGWGRSEKPRVSYDGELYIQLLYDFLHDVVGGKAVILAAGLPAAYAVQVAVDSPELVRALGLVVPLGIEVHGDEPDLKDALVHRLLKLPVVGTSALNLYTSRSGIGHHLRHEVYSAPERVDEELIDHHYVTSHQPGAQAALAAYLAGYLNHGVDELLPRLEVPTWIAWGRKAASPSVAVADLWLRLCDADLQVFEDSGNLPHAEQPRAFCRALNAYLEEIPE